MVRIHVPQHKINMKWPESLTLIRHAESAYNEAKRLKQADPLYQEFLRVFGIEWNSEDTQNLAKLIAKRFALGIGDHNTPLSQDAGLQAQTTAEKLQNLIALPDVIFVSPYQRTIETLCWMKKGWPELEDVKIYEEERIREKEHGLALLYNDWRVFHVLHPEQKLLHDLEGEYWYRFPQGENVPDVRERLRSWQGTLIRDFAGKNVLAVTHHLSILALRANMERLSADEFIELDHKEPPANCSVTIYHGHPELGSNGRFLLAGYNQKLY